MKFYMVETQSIVNYKYLIPVADEGYGAQAGKLAIDNQYDDIAQEHGEEEIMNISLVQDEDIEVAVEGSYMEGWTARSIKELFCVASKQNDTSEK